MSRSQALSELNRLIAHLSPEDRHANTHDLYMQTDAVLAERLEQARKGNYLSYDVVFAPKRDVPKVVPQFRVKPGAAQKPTEPKSSGPWPAEQGGLFG